MVQPGGAWAIPHLIGQSLSYALPNAQTATMPGTDGGVWASGDGCAGVYAVDGSAVTLYSGVIMDEPTFNAAAAELLAAVVAAG